MSTYAFPEQRERVGEAARRLVELRDGWLNPPGLDPADLAKRTFTNLYNKRPTWLANAHADLDTAVFAAYGWPPDLADTEVLERVLALNLERAWRSMTADTQFGLRSVATKWPARVERLRRWWIRFADEVQADVSTRGVDARLRMIP